MKKIILIVVLLCFGGKAMCHISKKDVRKQKEKYLSDSTYVSKMSIYRYAILEGDNHYTVFPDIELMEQKKQLQDIVLMERITYEGMKAARHDQRIPFFLRKN